VVNKGAVRKELRKLVEGSIGAGARQQASAPPTSCQRMVEAVQQRTKIQREHEPAAAPVGRSASSKTAR
jgi:hypothetical protein